MMKIIEYEKTLANSNLGNIEFVKNIINLMPKFVKESSEVVHKQKGSSIYKKDLPLDFIVITVEGEISIVNEFESGKIFEPVVIYPSDFIGIVEVVLNMATVISTNIAQTDVTFIKVPRNTFLKWVDVSHEITKLTLHSVCFNFKKNMAESGESVLLDSKTMFVSYLLKNSAYDNDLKMYIIKETREKTSIKTGINLRTLYRHVNSLKESGYITTHHRNIVFTDKMRKSLDSYYLQLRTK